MVKVRTLTGFPLCFLICLLQSCATNDELFARYDSEFCAVHPGATVVRQSPVESESTNNIKVVPASFVPAETSWEPVVYFDHNSSELTDKNKEKLAVNAQVLQKFDGYKISLKGYSDKPGSEEFNQILTAKRVAVVKKYFVEQFDLDGDVVVDVPHGESLEDITGTIPDDRARRVEIMLLTRQWVPAKFGPSIESIDQ